MPSEKLHNKSSDNMVIPQKYLDKIQKLQEDIEKRREQEYQLLRTRLDQTNELLSQLISISASGSTVAASKKYIPFNTGTQNVGQLDKRPTNPDDYPTIVNIYQLNGGRIIPHMTLINDGPGEIYFIIAYAKSTFNQEEGHIHINDQRELFNVYEIRLRSTLPLTTFRFIEGIIRTGSFAPGTRANVEIRPELQTNEMLKDFTLQFDLDVPITITVPTVQNFAVDPTPIVPINQAPLAPGATAALVDSSTLLPMPYNIPEGFIAETFAVTSNMSTDFTVRSYLELIPGFYTRIPNFPASNRGMPVNEVLNLSFYNTKGFDPNGAPVGGRNFLLTITNDDPFNNMVGTVNFVAIVRRLS